MAEKTKLPLAQAAFAARRLQTELAPYCVRIEIAGSIRRRKAAVGDIELVAIPKVDHTERRDLFGHVVATRAHNHLDEHLREMLRAPSGPIFKSRAELFEVTRYEPDGVPDVLRWGEHYKRFYFWWSHVSAVVSVDLFLATPANFGAILAIRTGPFDFSRELVTHIKHATPYRQQDGHLVLEETGEVMPVPEEADYFALAGVPWIDPPARTVAALRRVLREAET